MTVKLDDDTAVDLISTMQNAHDCGLTREQRSAVLRGWLAGQGISLDDIKKRPAPGQPGFTLTH